ncbi:hypothetical protein B0H14DRAFT_3903947 [Mycena olivaceomarginata]|nr:hypothetical protein B0H14DRAFT_3903947 [Mycena olivaceomarginata]
MTTTASILVLWTSFESSSLAGILKPRHSENSRASKYDNRARRREQGSGGRTGVQQGRDETAKLSSNGWGAAFGALHCSRAVTSSLHGEASHTHGSVLHSPCVDDSSTLRDSAVLATTRLRVRVYVHARAHLSPGAGAPHLAAQHAAATLKLRARVTVVPPPASHYNLGAPSPAAQHTMHRRCPRHDGIVRLAPRTEHVGFTALRISSYPHARDLMPIRAGAGFVSHGHDMALQAIYGARGPSGRARGAGSPSTLPAAASSLSGQLRARLFGSLTSPSCFYRVCSATCSEFRCLSALLPTPTPNDSTPPLADPASTLL